MRVVFMGTPPFAVPSFHAVADRHEIPAVFTRPDKPAGRGRTPVASPVKQAALERGVPVHQPVSLKDPAVVDALRRLAPDLVVVAAYGVILTPDILAVPRLGCVNVHASLLPRWRGAAPVQRAILAGDERTGVSIMRMTEGLDTGAYCLQCSVEVDDHTTASLTTELARVGAEALDEALPAIEAGTAEWVEQDESLATYAEKIGPDDVALAPGLDVVEAYRRIRASSRQAPAKACIHGTDVTITGAALGSQRVAPGYVRFEGSRLMLGFADGALEAMQLTPQGRASMEGASFARGARLDPDARWDVCRAR